MILKCIKEYNLDLNSSIMIGDKISDKIASDRANVKFYYKNKGNLFNQIKRLFKNDTFNKYLQFFYYYFINISNIHSIE